MNTQRLVDLWKELRDRRIIQIFTAYLAGGWIALEVIGALVERGILPELAYRLGLVIFLAGIPASLIIGWYHGEKGDQKVSLLELALLGLVVLGAVGGSAAVIDAHTKESLSELSEMDLRRIAVLYFDDLSPGNQYQHLADGFTEALIDQFHEVPGLDVVSRNGTAQYRGADISRDSIARALNAGTLIAGSIEPQGDRLRATVRLIDGASGTDIERQSFGWPADSLLVVRQELATEVSRLLRQWLGEEVRLRQRRTGTESVAAWTLVQRAERLRKEAEARAEGGEAERAFQAFARADSLLTRAATQDSAWVEPVVLRGFNDYRRSRFSFFLLENVPQTARWIEAGLEDAGQALRMEPRNARALELRGTLRYFKWLLDLAPSQEERERLLMDAREDLEQAVEIDPTLPGAYATLSHLHYYQTGDRTAAVLAARRAYEQDPYLENVEEVVWRLFNGSYDLGQFTQARNWCQVGARRFPADYRFTQCQLLMMTTPLVDPDPDRAWELHARLDSLAAPAYQRVYGQIFVGGIIGLAALEQGTDRERLRDSANTVLLDARRRATPEIDPHQELLSYEAAVRSLMGQEELAIDLYKRYLAANPGHAFQPGEEMSWWWRPLQDHPRFDELQAPH